MMRHNVDRAVSHSRPTGMSGLAGALSGRPAPTGADASGTKIQTMPD